ncbi:DUF7848 domain-containing protein [Streptomyces sp. URMC 129]|uniref:DUF7848 domain-containing protein n=1 Tax=Streptomyces sp. URMC 129 TaxID=3423407 RepID=UPI003F52F99C
MTHRAIIKAAEWELFEATAELSEEPTGDAPKALFRVACVDCGAESEKASNDPVPVEAWALSHTSRNPQHRRFKLSTEWFWLVLPARSNPLYELERRGGD